MELRAPMGRDLANVTGSEAGALVDLGSRWAVRLRGITTRLPLMTM